MMTENFLFIQALLAHLDRLEALLGDDWPAVSERLVSILDDLAQAENDEQAVRAVDEIFEMFLETPAEELVQALFEQAAEEAGTVDQTTRSVRITDPTSGESREVEVTSDSDSLADVVAAGEKLAFELRASRSLPESANEPSESTPRYFNTLFAAADGSAISSEQPLIHDQLYQLSVEINPEARGLGEDKKPFPDQALSKVWDDQATLPLTVWVASHDFDITLPQVQTLNLPPNGPSEVVKFTVRPKIEEDWGSLQVDLFYQGHLLQSKCVEARIIPFAGAHLAASVRPIQTARITFTTTDRLDPSHLEHLPERVFTINVERSPRDDSFDFRFLDRSQGDEKVAYYDTHLQPSSLGEAINKTRKWLKLTVTGSKKPKLEGYRKKLTGNQALLNIWLPRLATVGHHLYRAITESRKDLPPLNSVLKAGAIIQVNPVRGLSGVTIPWALLYGRDIKYVPGKTRVCENFVDSAPDCTLCADDPYVVCPSAFWGYRYAIEQLPCWTRGEFPQLPTLVRQIDNNRPLQLNLNVYRKFRFWKKHRQQIEAAGEVKVLVAEEIEEMETIWEERSSELAVVYFYSHGGHDDFLGPYLQLSDASIDSNFLSASNLKWPRAPLVFLNGCATGDYGPESYLSLIDDFRAAGASGVIGTECPVSELFAEAYARKLFARLFRGERLGEAMLAVRLDFLQKHKNPLGLLYTLYASNDIALARPVAHD